METGLNAPDEPGLIGLVCRSSFEGMPIWQGKGGAIQGRKLKIDIHWGTATRGGTLRVISSRNEWKNAIIMYKWYCIVGLS